MSTDELKAILSLIWKVNEAGNLQFPSDIYENLKRAVEYEGLPVSEAAIRAVFEWKNEEEDARGY